MSLTNTCFRIPFCLSMTIIFTLFFLTACQPLVQTQTGSQTKVPVISPRQDKGAANTEWNQPTAPAYTALTAEDIVAVPLRTATSSAEQLLNKTDTKKPEQPTVKIIRSSEPKKPAIKPTFNPADLVGRSHSYVSAQFGQADFNRTEGIIHVLQYQQHDCVIDLFINIGSTTNAAPMADAKILDWAMRERTISQTLDATLCQQQFYERKL